MQHSEPVVRLRYGTRARRRDTVRSVRTHSSNVRVTTWAHAAQPQTSKPAAKKAATVVRRGHMLRSVFTSCSGRAAYAATAASDVGRGGVSQATRVTGERLDLNSNLAPRFLENTDSTQGPSQRAGKRCVASGLGRLDATQRESTWHTGGANGSADLVVRRKGRVALKNTKKVISAYQWVFEVNGLRSGLDVLMTPQMTFPRSDSGCVPLYTSC